jgi:flagellar basal-body rod protein FlgF
MDGMLYTAMSGAQQTMLAQQANSNNLANANTTGFRADLVAFRSMPVYGDGWETRVFAMAERPNVDFTLGSLRNTERDLDVAVEGNGWIAVQGNDGAEAYTRAGNLSIEPGGILVTGAGVPVLGNGGLINIPQAESIVVGTDGTISIQPVGLPNSALLVVDRIKLVKPLPQDLIKGEDGLIRTISGEPADADGSVKVVSGSLETSNVNLVDTLVTMINLARRYEAQINVVKAAKELETSTDKLLSMS